ncbi:MAG: lysoplasmalogenase [Bacteroidota bacterium]
MKDRLVRPEGLRFFTVIFLLIAFQELAAIVWKASLPSWEYLAKPLVLASLILYTFWSTAGEGSPRIRFWLVLALLFSWFGDIALMFEGDLAFLLGLGNFLLSHLAYIRLFSFNQRPANSEALLLRKPWLVLPFLLYASILLAGIFPGLGNMTIAVIVYACVLMFMVLMALNRYNRVPEDSFGWVFMGALLFMISDSILAWDRFADQDMSIPFARIWIMLTYMGAQFMIVLGMLQYILSRPSSKNSS